MKSLNYYIFSHQLKEFSRKKEFPLRVIWEITYRCNFNCIHCYIPQNHRKNNKKELPKKRIYSLIEQLKDLGVFYLGFTGGEPFLREDFLSILTYAKKRGFQVIINSNGSLLDKEKILFLADLGINKIDITLPSLDKESFSKITQTEKENLKRIIKAIKLLHKYRVNFSLKTCLLKENQAQIPKIRDFAKTLKVDFRLDVRLFPNWQKDTPFKYRAINPASLKLKPHFKKNNKKPTYKDLFFCGAGITQFALTPYSEIKPCLMLNYPKFMINNDIFSSYLKMKNFIKSINLDKFRCFNCSLKKFCPSCPAIRYILEGNFFSCDQESKNWALYERSLNEQNKIKDCRDRDSF